MTKLNAFAKIKALFNNEHFNDANVADGTLIQWEGELGEGTAIMVIDTDGNTTPAPDATHEVNDGTVVTTVGVLVTMIEPKSEDVIEEDVEQPVKKDNRHTLYWTDQVESLLSGWADTAAVYKWLHDKSHRKYKRKNKNNECYK